MTDSPWDLDLESEEDGVDSDKPPPIDLDDPEANPNFGAKGLIRFSDLEDEIEAYVAAEAEQRAQDRFQAAAGGLILRGLTPGKRSILEFELTDLDRVYRIMYGPKGFLTADTPTATKVARDIDSGRRWNLKIPRPPDNKGLNVRKLLKVLGFLAGAIAVIWFGLSIGGRPGGDATQDFPDNTVIHLDERPDPDPEPTPEPVPTFTPEPLTEEARPSKAEIQTVEPSTAAEIVVTPLDIDLHCWTLDNFWNLRTLPSIESEVIQLLDPGTRLCMEDLYLGGEGNNWIYAGIGWIHANSQTAWD